ncbi:MAG TPA: FecR domain-containing protein [Bryobacteraceae bacterium]|jgi:hypothetical protein|nr:FecR domain-containing protein [Bryobacteraceae bacterium]
MIQSWQQFVRLAVLAFVSGVLVFAQNNVGRPGAVNYVEGNVTLDGRALNAKSIGSTEVGHGDVIQTGQGKAEILLIPGAFIRLDDNSALQMVSPELTNTQVQLKSGRAVVEVDQIEKENHLAILDNGISTTLEKQGIYQFDANPASVAVYDGKAVAQIDDKGIEVGKGKRLVLTAGIRKPEKFDREQTGELYAWSKLRSGYMAEANASSAQTIIVNSPGWYYGTGWYWNPWFDSWAFVPGAGYLYSPFGFGFYSPAFVYYGGWGGYWGGGYWRGYHGFRGGGFHGGGFGGGFRGGGGFHGGGGHR